MQTRKMLVAAISALLSATVVSQEQANIVAPDDPIPASEYAKRRAAIVEKIGKTSIAIVFSATMPPGRGRFEQNNDFYYLTGLNVPNSYLAMMGPSGVAVLYVPHKTPKLWKDRSPIALEDADGLLKTSGVAAAFDPQFLATHLAHMASETAVGNVYLPLLAAERPSETRYEAMTTNVEREIDPWDGGLPRETRMANLLRARFPTLTVQNLSPILNDLRARKSDAEIAKIRKATRVGIAALVESMRSTRAGLRETDLEAVASFVSLRSHARPFTPAVVASGSNTFDLHYNANDGALRAGDLVFMQSTASLDGYATDVARMWPVDGRFTPSQLEIYRFYLACYDAILKRIRPGPNPQEINKETGHDLEQILQATHFEHAGHAKAASEFVRIYRESVNTSRMTVGYGYDVGLSPRDVSTSPWRPLQTGAVLTVQPFFYVPDDHLMMRISDVVLVTADGAEVLSKELPRDPAELQRLVGTGGMLQASARAGSQ